MAKINFKARKKAREYALQALYGYELTRNSLKEIETYMLVEHAADKFDQAYFLELLHQLPARLVEIENCFEPFLTRKISELDYIELTILRIATFELLFRMDIPYRVVINEALELAKKFGAVESFKFINGVLDKVSKVTRPIEHS